ncbi:PhzF family phenazine biosynthesis protein [Nesterenkonia flava]
MFAEGAFSGNPVAVIDSAEDLSDEQMRTISRWTNLSECTFLLPPENAEADYRVRIFALDTELPFAGHPTLGTARAWLDLGGIPRQSGTVIQECGVGLVQVRLAGEFLAFAAPPLRRSGPLAHQDGLTVHQVLGLRPDQVLDAAWVDNGPGWCAVLVDSVETLLDVRPNPGALRADGPQALGVAALGAENDDVALHVRAFFPDGAGSLVEDPVTGSLNASLAQWLTGTGRLNAPYTASQGTVIGRNGRVSIEAEGETLWVGGRAQVRVTGTVVTG